MEHLIAHGPVFTTVEFVCAAGETIAAQPGAMLAMSTGFELTARVGAQMKGGRGLGRAVRSLAVGESFFAAVYEARRDGERLTLAPEQMGDIRALEIGPSNRLLIATGAFLACTSGVQLSAVYAGVKGLMTTRGLFLMQTEGAGQLFLASFGAIIHLLDEPELESVVGHELGHVFPYAPLLSRCYLLHAACAAAVSFAFAATFNTSAAVLLAPFAMLWILDWVIAFPHLRLSRGIEFLCDDFGAQAAGLIPALSSEFKIGAESEARQQILAHLLDATGRGKTIDPSELMEVYESAVPFGRSDPTAARLEIERLSASRGQADRRTSLGGFIRYLGERGDSGDQQEAIGEELARLKVVSELPLVPVDREPYLHGSAGWTMDNAARLTRTLEEHPHAVLFRQAEELTDEFTTHPNVSRRILFLWRNRSV